jgi:4a-hydroxytetrahydrobiopterin dehydratase
MDKLNEQQLREALAQLEHWSEEEGALVTAFEFDDFLAAIDFVGVVAELAEKSQHHPRITIDYNVVELALYTHDAKAITQKDIDFAHAIEQLPLFNEEDYYD